MGSPPDPFAAVHEYIEAFNKGDVKTMAAKCANPMSILDGLAPHVWHGPRACEDWYSDAMAAGDREGAKGYVVALGKPWHVDVTGDRAYVVVPTTMSFNVRGKQVTQSGAVYTVALRQQREGWRIVSWAWAKGSQQG